MGGRRFRYPLEPIALQRQWALDALLRILGDCNAELAQQRMACAAESARIAQAQHEWIQLGRASQVVQVERFALLSRYLADRWCTLHDMEQVMQEVQQRQEALIAEVAGARRALDAVKKHRGELQKEFVRACQSGEFKEADDQWNVLQTMKAADGNQC